METRERQNSQKDDLSTQTQGGNRQGQGDDTFSGGGLSEATDFGTGQILPAHNGQPNVLSDANDEQKQYGGSGTWEGGEYGGAPGSPIMEIKIYAPPSRPSGASLDNGGKQKDKFSGSGTWEAGEYGGPGNLPLIEIRLFSPAPMPQARPKARTANKGQTSG